ncbi:SDR family oxidoreductase [Empedobacter falsenii]|uniref:SDR family NAD(P)-dependent oxidoreductase n=1 Tax=Empedobacter TaxID=59734 RepID=UPI00244D4E2E|nr:MULTISPECIES: SDR family oxidoreductase [Empedobacter]MDH1884034.1 SDR family oxidoreductase [Empedobacter sp. GD03797]MDM1063788.1 SDR family oxidoreductase [Empedobacter falsenii]
MTKFEYQSALITGASSGIGKSFAYLLASKGVNLVLSARSEDKLLQISEELKAEFKINVVCIKTDLSEINASQLIFDQIAKQNISIDLLINNAGIGKWTNFLDESINSYQEMIQLNVNSLVTLTQLFLPQMLQNKKGGIINIASTGALQPCPYIAVYCATKSFVLNFSESLYGEYFDKGITVTAICPGNTQTDFQKTARANTQGMSFESPDEVAKQSIEALLKRKNNKIIGFNNYLQSFIPRLLSRKIVIKIVKNMMDKKVNG